jgi:hypothetical protein
MLGEIVERVPHRLTPGAVPAKPAGLAIGEGLAVMTRARCGRDRFVEPAADVIGADLPPQRQRLLEQPAPECRASLATSCASGPGWPCPRRPLSGNDAIIFLRTLAR